MPPTRLPDYGQVRRVARAIGFYDSGQGKGDREKWRSRNSNRWVTIDGHNGETVNRRDFRLMCEQMGIVDETGHADFDLFWRLYRPGIPGFQRNPVEAEPAECLWCGDALTVPVGSVVIECPACSARMAVTW